MREIPPTLWPGLAGLAALAALFASYAAFTALGAAAGGRRRFAPADPVVGWGLGGGLLTLWGVLPPGGLTLPGLALMGAGVVALAWVPLTGGSLAAPGRWRVPVLLLPLFLYIAGSGVTHWDDFSHWFVNHGYLLRYDGFPAAGMPESTSHWPAYPYGLSLWDWLVSRLAGHYVEVAGALVNVVLLAAAAGFLIDAILRGNPDLRASTRSGRWALAAAGALLVIPLNPAFHRSTMVSGVADSATAVALAATGLLVWRMLESLRDGDGDRADAVALARQAGFAAAALVNLKQVNLVLLALLIGAALLLALRDPRLRAADLLRRLPWLLGPAAVVYLVWRWFVVNNLPGQEFAFLPMERWRIHLIPDILHGMWRFAIAESLHCYLMLLAVALLGLRGLWRCRTPFDRLALLSGAVAAGYIAFLFFTYLAAGFSDAEAVRGASFWRYTIQVSLFAWVAAVHGLALLTAGRLRPLSPGPWHVAAAAALALLVPALTVAMPTQLVRTRDVDIRTLGRTLSETLPEGARVAVIEDGMSGLHTVILRYELWRAGRDDRGLRVAFRGEVLDKRDTAAIAPRLAADPTITHVLILDATPAQAEAFGVPPAAGHRLLEHSDGGWRPVAIAP